MKFHERKFADYLRSKNYSPASIRSYVSAVNLYHAQGYLMKAESLCKWKEDETARVSAATVNLRLHALNAYAECIGLSFRLKPLRISEKDYVDDELTPAMYRRLVSGLATDSLEWYAVIKLLACTGMRISEAAKVEGWHIRQGWIDIVGKGDKMRRVWFPSGLRKDLRDIDGVVIRHSAAQVRKKMKAMATAYSIPARVMHPHAFRAFFARRVYEKTKDIQFVQKLLGHSSIKTTMRYLRKSAIGMKRRISQIVDW